MLALMVGLALGAAAADAQTPVDIDPRVQTLLARISDARLKATVEKLQSFQSRNTLSNQGSPTSGIGAAAQWIHDEMSASSARLQVSFDTYEIPAQGERVVRDVRVRNVMAVLPGRSPRRVYVCGHYDSVARITPAASTAGGNGGQATAPAARAPDAGGFDWSSADHFQPGANDDGSGTALVIELARVFGASGIDFDATLVFIALAGEEQGLVGASLHAQKAEAEKLIIDAVLNNDIVGNVTGGTGVIDAESVRVFSEGPEDSPSRQIARYVQQAAARYVPAHRVRLVARHDRFGRGGDHTAFNQHGFAGVRVTEANENYSRQHTDRDTADGVDAAYLARNARVNAAAAASLAIAPAAPRVVDDRGRPRLTRAPSGYDANLAWDPSPGAVGYRVYWRDAWTLDWQHGVLVGSVTTFVLPGVSIDDAIFGVAAVGPAGHESLVSAYVNPPRAETTIKTR